MFFRSCFMVAKRQSKLTTFLGYVFRSKKAVDPRSDCTASQGKLKHFAPMIEKLSISSEIFKF